MLNLREGFRGPVFNRMDKGAHSQLQVWPFTSTALLKDVIESDWGCKLAALICPMSTHPWEVQAVLIQAGLASSPQPGLKRKNPSSLVCFPPLQGKAPSGSSSADQEQTQASCGSSLFELALLAPIKVPFSGACQPGCLGWHSGVYLALVSFLSSSKKPPLISMPWIHVLGLECSTQNHHRSMVMTCSPSPFISLSSLATL